MLWKERFKGCPPIGTIYFDRSSKGKKGRHHSWRAEITVGSLRIRRRFQTYEECESFLIETVESNDGAYWPQNSVLSLRKSLYE